MRPMNDGAPHGVEIPSGVDPMWARVYEAAAAAYDDPGPLTPTGAAVHALENLPTETMHSVLVMLAAGGRPLKDVPVAGATRS